MMAELTALVSKIKIPQKHEDEDEMPWEWPMGMSMLSP